MTYYQFLRLFNNLAQSHPNVKTFSVGEVVDADFHKQTLFPLMHLVTENMTISSGKMVYSFNLLVMDNVSIVKRDSYGQFNRFTDTYIGHDNTIDIINTSQQTLGDIFAYLQRNPQSYTSAIDTDIVITPFIEKGNNLLAGCAATFQVSTGFTPSACSFTLTDADATGNPNPCGPFIDTNFLIQQNGYYILQQDNSRLYWI